MIRVEVVGAIGAIYPGIIRHGADRTNTFNGRHFLRDFLVTCGIDAIFRRPHITQEEHHYDKQEHQAQAEAAMCVATAAPYVKVGPHEEHTPQNRWNDDAKEDFVTEFE